MFDSVVDGSIQSFLSAKWQKTAKSAAASGPRRANRSKTFEILMGRFPSWFAIGKG
jgi:hypothetical protein